MMDALSRARELIRIEACDSLGGLRSDYMKALAALVAEIDAAPLVTVVETDDDFIIGMDTRDTEKKVEDVSGKRVRLLALDSGGAGEVEK